MGKFAAFLLTPLLLLVPAAPSAADTYVKIDSHTDAYYYMGQNHPAADRTVEFWFGKNRMAYVTESQIIVIKGGDSSLVFVTPRDSSYVETRLPFQWSSVVSKETLGFLDRYKRRGEISHTTESKKIGGWQCRKYVIDSWLDVEDGRYSEREETVWMSKDLPLDWKFFERVHRDILELSNYRGDFIDELLKIGGFSVVIETKTYVQGFSVNSIEKIVDVQEKSPPAGIYSVPAGFRKKAELTLQDLNG